MELASVVETVTAISVILLMISASRDDFRTREVSDMHWAAIGIIGLTGHLFTSHLTGNLSFTMAASLLAGALFLLSVLVESERISLTAGLLSLTIAIVSLLIADGNAMATGCSISVLYCCLFVVGFYTGLIRGGADAKCLMAIALAFPVYSDFGSSLFSDVPAILKTLFPPAVATLFLGSILSVVGCAVYCTYMNLQNQGLIRGFYRGYMMPAVMVPISFAWPAENIVGGERVRCGIPADEDVEEICDRYRENGIYEMYVTPMMPFVVPLTAALVFVLVFGNPLFIL